MEGTSGEEESVEFLHTALLFWETRIGAEATTLIGSRIMCKGNMVYG